ncbi:acetylglutamate kinase [Vibrio mangrovi]|uniref:Acetylglutamate kinase n=1 Tax=Vibrio mangrovi TaxID=474394 RepID=A0A1Y6IYW5_9VIBR|nr:acetylglutamate kinase [Vibrio mangrovi]MDW6002730.1 acetylglutamate kinase [Vibrio mangrovi]SMS02221.1 Acetylglutamate kinase [Vibrio mangrovi]
MEQSSHPVVIKLGGAVLSSTETLATLFQTIAQYQSSRPIAIVHGGGYLVDELMSKLQFDTVKKHGLRVTPYDQIPFIAGALAGTANKLLQGEGIKNGLKAVGLCLGDAGLCHVEELDPELGAVGRPSAGDPTVVNAIMQAGGLPIISSIGLTDDGQMMNVNADDAAVAVAKTLNAELVLLSDVSGVLDENKQLIPELNEEKANQLIADGVITDGMIVKVKAALEAADDLGRAIIVAGWRTPELLAHVFAGDEHSIGTGFYPTTK